MAAIRIGVPAAMLRKPATSTVSVREPITKMSTSSSRAQVATSRPSIAQPATVSGTFTASRIGLPDRASISRVISRTPRT